MKYSLILTASLLAISVTLHTMEITDQDFILKQKNYGLKGRFYPTDTNYLFYALKTTKDSKDYYLPSHELLWWATSQDLCKDVKNEVMLTRYYQIVNNLKNKPDFLPFNTPIVGYQTVNGLLERHDSSFNPIIEPEDAFFLNKGQLKVLCFFDRRIRLHWGKDKVIDDTDIEFSQEMIKQLDSLPPKIRLKLNDTIARYYYVKTSEPSFFNACLGQNPGTRRIRTNMLTDIAEHAFCASSICALFKISAEIGAPLPLPLIGGLAIGFSISLVGYKTKNYIYNSLNPSDIDENMKMLGLEKRYFLNNYNDDSEVKSSDDPEFKRIKIILNDHWNNHYPSSDDDTPSFTGPHISQEIAKKINDLPENIKKILNDIHKNNYYVVSKKPHVKSYTE